MTVKCFFLIWASLTVPLVKESEGFEHLQCSDRIQYNDTVSIVVLLPNDTSRTKYLSSIRNVKPGLILAVKKVNEMKLLPGLNFKLDYFDTSCDVVIGPWASMKVFFETSVNLFLGPVCDYPVATVARFLRFFKVPLITAGAFAHDFSLDRTREKPEYHLLVRIGRSFTGMAFAVNEFFRTERWKKFVMLYQSDGRKEVLKEHYCMLAIQAIHRVARGPNGNCTIKTTLLSDELDEESAEAVLKEDVGVNNAIIVMCASPDTIRDILLAAEKLDMISRGEYVFFSIELFTSKMDIRKPWHRDKDPPEKNARARHAYEALLTISARIPETEEYKNFSKAVKRIAKEELHYEYGHEEVNTFVTAFHEAVILYSLALNETLSEGYSISNGSIIVQKMWNRTFDGITGNVTIDENGDRDADYSILDLNPETEEFEVVANYIGTEKKVVDVQGRKIHWAGGLTEPPTDNPECGFDGSKCPKPDYQVSLTVVLSAMVVFLFLGSAALYRYYRREAQLASMNWKIKWEEISVACSDKKRRPGSRMSLSRISVTSTVSAETLPVCDFNKPAYIKTGYYKGTVVVLKPIRKSKIEINRPLLLEIKMIKDLQHDHIVRFIGAVIDFPHSYIVTEYSLRGSLQDILENEQIKLDWMFRYSLMHDLVKGMAYLHNTEVRSHGNLKSSNCVVDSRFALKITDFGLHSLRHSSENDENMDSYTFWRRKLWTAPELLRMHSPPAEGSQKGDVYSFALIAHEIAVRQGIFYLGPAVELSPKEIVEKVKNGQKPPFRPLLDKETCDEEVIHMIRRCWTEDPAERPDFQALKLIIRRLNKDNDSGNILDNLLSRMEQYANNLEALVEERTADYLEEKRKAEDLLYQLLPRSVASQLIRGESVTAEAFDGVTIYFSDIVGFTTLSAESTPMEVVDFLNDLYTCFDSVIENFDVYKVETIGDAYMVVSGLPVRNGNLHAREIARMSLALLNTVKSFTIRHRPSEQLKLRIGLHTGPCAAGVVGLKMPRYCLFGDTVNTASRMESTGLPLRIHLSTKTKEVLDTFKTFLIELRGDIEIKGKGKMTTYWLIGEKGVSPPNEEQKQRAQPTIASIPKI